MYVWGKSLYVHCCGFTKALGEKAYSSELPQQVAMLYGLPGSLLTMCLEYIATLLVLLVWIAKGI